MPRTPRRIIECDPPPTPVRTALEHELSGWWPLDGSRVRFWTGAAIPDHLHESRRPDPRQVLGDEADHLEYERELAFWNQARSLWLQEQLNG